MGKNSDRTSISNSLAMTILHEILIEHTNKSESSSHMKKEAIEYRGQSLKKVKNINLNDEDKKIIKDKIIRKITSRLKIKYSDIKVSQKEISKKVDEELFYLFE